MFWEYKAGNGSIDIRVFEITCPLADDIRQAYGLARAEPTAITRPRFSLNRQNHAKCQPSYLKIEGNKIDKWLDFVECFQFVNCPMYELY
jgi:serine/threonine-protein kinase